MRKAFPAPIFSRHPPKGGAGWQQNCAGAVSEGRAIFLCSRGALAHHHQSQPKAEPALYMPSPMSTVCSSLLQIIFGTQTKPPYYVPQTYGLSGEWPVHCRLTSMFPLN